MTNQKIESTVGAHMEHAYEYMMLPVEKLEIDRLVQRTSMDYRKVERFKKNFNADALGIITVSKRVIGGNVIMYVVLDGQHRTQVVRELTSNTGEMACHVFSNLTQAEEAQMFLDLNAGNRPHALDQFRVRVVAGDSLAITVDNHVRAYGWTVAPGANEGNIQAVKALERIQKRSDKDEFDPSLLQCVIMCVTHAWGKDPQAVQGIILEGIGALIAEHERKVDLSRLTEKLRKFPGGPDGLVRDARAISAAKRSSVPMGVAEILTEDYNKGLRTEGGKALGPWRHRKFPSH
jgi:hypothetical protein